MKNSKKEQSSEHHQSSNSSDAPTLLKNAFKSGDVKADDSEEEEKKESSDKDNNDKDEQNEPHVHQRANQLDFLLSKASEYSNFIAADLKDLQDAMAADAAKKMEGAGKKRKKSQKGGKSKKSKQGEANLKSAQDKYVEQLSAGAGGRPIFIQPPLLANGCVLKDYQLEGVRWLTSLFENGVSGILADEMGLGKTIQVIAMIAHLKSMHVLGPFLIVAPLATLPNWVREFQKWLPSLPVIRYHGSAQERETMLKGPLNPKKKRDADFPAIVTSYEVAIKDEKKLNKIGEFTYLVVDEGQRLKNHRCTLIQSLKRIKAANRLLLSGTPIQNNLDELWSLLNFVNPAIFDDLSVFQSWFGFKDIGQKDRRGTKEEDIMLEQRKNQTVTKLHEILRPFLLRRIKRDVLTDLPPKKEVVVYAGMSKLQSGYADLIEKGVLRDVLISQGIEQGRSLSQTNKQMNQRKNANHPFLFGEPIDPNSGVHLGTAHPQLLVRASGKFALLDRMLERLHKDKHQVLIFSQMTALLNVIEDYLLWRKWKYCRIDGSTNIDERQKQMDTFNAEKTGGADGGRNDSDDRHFVFLLSTRAGGLGINLATADTCIIFDSDWNPHQDAQAQDRCYRIGQNRPVAVYRLLTVNSVDVEMMEAQMSKNKLARMAITGGDFRKAGVRSKGEFSTENLSVMLEDDIKDLQAKGGDIESIKINDDEFDSIMDRKKLFAVDAEAIPTEGKMYDIVDGNKGDSLLGSVNA
jgi:ATP-dependent DNA helicase